MNQKVDRAVLNTLGMRKMTKVLRYLPLEYMLHVKPTMDADNLAKSYVLDSLPQCNKDVPVKD